MLDIVLYGTYAPIIKWNNIGAFYLHQREWEHVLQGDMVDIFPIFQEVGFFK